MFLGVVEGARVNPLSANFTKWSNTLKQFVGKLLANCLSVFDHFVGLAPKVLRKTIKAFPIFNKNWNLAKNGIYMKNAHML